MKIEIICNLTNKFHYEHVTLLRSNRFVSYRHFACKRERINKSDANVYRFGDNIRSIDRDFPRTCLINLVDKNETKNEFCVVYCCSYDRQTYGRISLVDGIMRSAVDVLS